MAFAVDAGSRSVVAGFSDLRRWIASTTHGTDASMWRDMVWHFKKYFGRVSCVGSPASMAADAERTGKRWHRGQKAAKAFYLAA